MHRFRRRPANGSSHGPSSSGDVSGGQDKSSPIHNSCQRRRNVHHNNDINTSPKRRRSSSTLFVLYSRVLPLSILLVCLLGYWWHEQMLRNVLIEGGTEIILLSLLTGATTRGEERQHPRVFTFNEANGGSRKWVVWTRSARSADTRLPVWNTRKVKNNDQAFEDQKARQREQDERRRQRLHKTYHERKTFKLHDKHPPQCQLREWQTRPYPVCNKLHELVDDQSPVHVWYLAKGSQSVVMEYADDFYAEHDRDNFGLVLKTQRFQGSYVEGYTEDSFNRRLTEAMALERLSPSKYIVDTWGFCGMSSIAPMATRGDLQRFLASTKQGKTSFSKLDRLKVAYQVAQGVADLHGIDKTPSVSHLDLDTSQHVYVDGIFRLNDFGYGKMIRHDPTNHNLPCLDTTYPIEEGSYKAPEELRSILNTGEQVRLDKTDVYGLGNEIYTILTGKWVFEGDLSNNCKRVIRGQRPKFPSHILKADDDIVSAMRKAIDMCWQQDPLKRASAHQVAQFLKQAVMHVTQDDPTSGVDRDGLVRIRLPKYKKPRGDGNVDQCIGNRG